MSRSSRFARSNQQSRLQSRHLLAPLAASLLMPLAAAAQAPAAPGNPAAGPAASPPAARPDAAAPKPFAEVVKDAKEIPGLIPMYQKEDKIWLELAPEQFDQPLFLTVNQTRGMGEAGIFGNWMLRSHIVEFKRMGSMVQLIAKNTRFTAEEGTPLGRAARQSFTDSLLGSVPVGSAPHPTKKTVLVEANGLFLTDIPGYSTQLETTFRLPYAFDARNSGFVNVRNSPDMVGLGVSAHYGVPRLPAPPLVPGAPQVPQPSTLEDNRSLFLGFYYSLAKLPETPMRARVADDRVGHFVQRRWDYSTDMAPFPRQQIVQRWRLEKQDPAAALSEPKAPIVFWLDNNIPVKYREKVKAGILEWLPAFEKIGFKNAIVVKQQPDNADFDLNDARHSSVRWYLDTSDGALAIGPRRWDPRTGEILDADISFSDGWTRLPRRRAAEQLTSVATQAAQPAASMQAAHAHARGDDTALCSYAGQAMEEVSFALDLLAARGDMEPDSPEAEAIVLATLKDVVTHEVGHTLGFTHNFRASTIYTLDQMEDSGFTAKHGLAGSVMDYNALNIAPKGRKQGEYVMSTLGPYDYWAVEYAYKPLDPATESIELKKIAARSTEPDLAFANDLDAGLGPVEGMDPTVHRRDLGADPLAFAARRMQLSRELWERLQAKQLKPGESYEVLTRNFVSGGAQVALAATIAAKHVGGVVHVRDHAGSTRPTFAPVPAATQRAALKLLNDELFRADSFRFNPEFVSRLAPDQFDRQFGGAGTLAAAVNPDVSISGAVLNLQRGVLDQLLSDGVAARLLDASSKVADAKQIMPLSEVYDALQNSIWSEVKTGAEIAPLRRNLQREHLRRVANALVRPSGTTPADARSLQRENATQLTAELRAALAKGKFSKETRAHLGESLATLNEALKAPLLRTSA